MNLLAEKEDIKFQMDTSFDIRYLTPVHKFVQWKLENNKWDDYNELYHASKLIERLKTQENIWLDTHLLFKNEAISGVVLIVRGEIKNLENKYSIEDQEDSLLLKYFHQLRLLLFVSQSLKKKNTHYLLNFYHSFFYIYPKYMKNSVKFLLRN